MIDLADASYVANNMRPSDVSEVWQASRATPAQALYTCILLSQEVNLFRVDGKPAMYYGVYQAEPGGTGQPWLLGTPALESVRKSFMAECRGAVARWRAAMPRLENRVLASNHTSVRFLEALGFQIGEPRTNEHGAVIRPFWAEGFANV